MRTRRIPTATALALGLTAACAAGSTGSPPGEGVPAQGPTLVVSVVVDQLRADLLDRYDAVFEDGFRRIRDEGFRYTGASHRHAITETAAGHATISTGVFPSRHGLVANDWSVDEPGGRRPVYAVEDPESPIVGVPELPGRSPSLMLRDGLADWVLAADPDARIVSISNKDRAAIPMAGRTRAHVYWISPYHGSFVTSTWYRDEIPEWVERVNEETVIPLFADTTWLTDVPPAGRSLSRRDTVAYEGDGEHTFFPHLFAQEAEDGDRMSLNLWNSRTPVPDRAVLALAEAAVEEFDLGEDASVDYLGLSFSQVDYVGHDYGPNSREQLDNLMRLDRVLGELFRMLDREVGEGRWVLALTGDHGVLDAPEWAQEQGRWGYRVTREDFQAMAELVREGLEEGGTEPEIRARIARRIEGLPFIARAYTHDEIQGSGEAAAQGAGSVPAATDGEPPDTFLPLYRNSYYPGRLAGVLSPLGLEPRAREGALFSVMVRGTTHGQPYWYDRHVPMLFMGAGIRPGVSDAAVYTVDVAPTLADLARIPYPGDLDGRHLFPR